MTQESSLDSLLSSEAASEIKRLLRSKLSAAEQKQLNNYLHELFSRSANLSPGPSKPSCLKSAGSGSESATQIMKQLNNLVKKYNNGTIDSEQREMIINSQLSH